MNFLLQDFPNLLEDIPLRVRQEMWLQLDGAPPHFGIASQQQLNLMFPNKWIGRSGPTPFPARSPDLTCMDFYLWGKVKDLAYFNRPTTAENMKQRIKDIFRNHISEAELEAVHLNFIRRVEKCLESNGGHFEHLLN